MKARRVTEATADEVARELSADRWWDPHDRSVRPKWGDLGNFGGQGLGRAS